MQSKQVLMPFVKAPLLGQVKTRLQPELSEREALLLYSGMLADLSTRIGQNKVWDTLCFFCPVHVRQLMDHFLPKDVQSLPQCGKDLGERMQKAFEHVFSQGYDSAVLIGSDLPFMQTDHIENAFKALDNHDLVLVPTEDGGYGLIGMKQVIPCLFQNMMWGTEHVLPETLSRAETFQLYVHTMEPQFDVDTVDDVLRLWKKVKTLDASEKESYLKTIRALEKIQIVRKKTKTEKERSS